MASALHETLIEMFKERPALARDLLAKALDVDVPHHDQVRLESADCTVVVPIERRADAVLTFQSRGAPALALVVEVQLGIDRKKLWSWPLYLTVVGARLECPAMLLVVCVDDAVARWAARPNNNGHPGFTLAPLVLRRGLIPIVHDLDQARQNPELTVLSAMAHGDGPDGHMVLLALRAALETLPDDERATLYADTVAGVLPVAAQRIMEEVMATRTREYTSDMVRRWVLTGREEGREAGREEGRAAGEAEAVLKVLAARGVEVPDDARERIITCVDLAQLDVWLGQAVTAVSIKELFD